MARDARLNIDVTADTSAARRDLDRFSRRAGAWAGVTSAAVGGVWNAAIAGAQGAVRALGDAVQSAAELSGQVSTAGQRFGEAATGVERWAESAASGLGLSERAALDAANSFAVFGAAAGLSDDELAGFSTDLTTLAVDLAALNNVTPTQAVENLTSAFRGSTEVLDNLGIIANEAALKQAFLAETGEEVSGSLTGQQRAIALTALLYEQGADAQGQFARESDELITQQAVATAQWENLTATLGEALIPVVSEVLDIFVNDVVPMLKDLWAEIQPVVSALIEELTPAFQSLWATIQNDILPILRDLWSWLAANVLPILDDLWQTMQTYVIPQVQRLWSSFKELLEALRPLEPVAKGLALLLGGLLKAALISVGALIDALSFGMRALATIIRGVTEAVRSVTAQIQQLVDWIKQAIDWIGRLDLGALASAAGGFLGGILPLGQQASGAGSRTVTVNYNLTVGAPIGTSAGDVGAAIVAHLNTWESQNGRRYFTEGR